MDYYRKCSQCRARDADLVDEGGLPKCYPCEVRLQSAAIQLLRDMLAHKGQVAPEAAEDAPDDGLAHDDWEVPPSPDDVAQVREALRRAENTLAGLRNALVFERELQARCAELERERDAARAEVASLEAQAEQGERYVSGLEDRVAELKHSDDMRALALRDQHAEIAALKADRDDMIATCAAGAAEIAKSRQDEREYKAQIAALTADRDAARADLARYTAIYGDPDAPVDVASFAVGEPDAPPLFPGLAAMADRILAAPQIKVGDHVRCESLGNLTGVVETVNPSDKPGWDQCLVRDDREGHVWGAAAFILEVIR